MSAPVRRDDDASTPRACALAIEAAAPDDAACRVCLCDATEAPESRLVKLQCACVGVYVHETCAQTWTRTRGTNVCEVCGRRTQFDVPMTLAARALRRLGVASDRERDDDARDAGPSVGDVIWIFLITLCVVWMSLQLMHGMPTGPALAMSYCYGVAIFAGAAFFAVPLRRARASRRDSRAVLWIYALSMLATHQIAFALALRRIPTDERRIKHAYSLTFAVSVAAFAYPHVVTLGACLWRALARGDASH